MTRLSSLVVVFLLCVASSYANKVVDVETICKKAQNPSLCLSLLKPKSGGDLVSLASYTIDVVRTDLTKTTDLIKALIAKSGGDPKTKSHYENCLSHFGIEEGALGEVAQAKQLLTKGDYDGVNVHASAIMTDVDDCISGDSPGEPPFHDPSMLPKDASVIQQVSDIILIITNFLLNQL